ncbi:MAG: BatA domain-containing protein [Candidatus Hydrogenedentes bacterium]|nr:BatA domain-containing protein [Candidatus Hydrogenedentota bacterium]
MGGWTIAWTNPALIAGALAVLVPYLVHLLTKRTPRTLVFPTIQFLRRAHANQSALFRMRDVVLLLVRTAFVSLLLLAFLKPVLRARAMVGDDNKRQAAVVVLDASMSMRYMGGTPFARAQQAAEKVLDHLDRGGVVNVILAGASPAASLDAPGENTAPLRRDLLSMTTAPERADVDSALAEAVRQLQPFSDHVQTIYLVSDFQRSNWSSAKFDSVPEDIKLVFLPVGDSVTANWAITDVLVRPRSPVLSETVEIVCTVANYSSQPVDVPVRLSLREIAPQSPDNPERTEFEKPVSLAPGSSGTASFRFRAAHTGAFEGTAQVPDDALDDDNARYFTVHVDEQIDVLVVSDAANETRSSAHFVWRALDPHAGAANGQPARRASAMRTRVVRARDLDLRADPPHVLVLDGAGPLSESAVAELHSYLAGGGAAIYFLSDVLDKGNLESLALVAKDGYVAPLALAAMIDRADVPDSPGKLTEVKREDPIFRRFQDTEEISQLAFYRYFTTERLEGRGEVLARYDDGNIALGKGTAGAGALLLCNFSAGRDASTLAQTPAFVPLLHEMVKSARPSESVAGGATVGFTAAGSVSVMEADTGLLILAPSGKTVNASTERRGESLSVLLQAAHERGFYRINDGSLHLGSIAVNVDARESDLLPLNEAQLRELSASPGRKIASMAAQSARPIDALLEGVPIWPYLLVAALGLLGVEQLFLIVLKR